MTTNCCIVLHAHSLFYLAGGRESLIAYLHERTGCSTHNTTEILARVQAAGFTIPRLCEALRAAHLPHLPNPNRLEADLIAWFAHELRPHDEVRPTLTCWAEQGVTVAIVASHPTGALVTMLPHTESSTVEAGQELTALDHYVVRYGARMPILYVDASPARLDRIHDDHRRRDKPTDLILCHIERNGLYDLEQSCYRHHSTRDLNGVDHARLQLLAARQRVRRQPLSVAAL